MIHIRSELRKKYLKFSVKKMALNFSPADLADKSADKAQIGAAFIKAYGYDDYYLIEIRFHGFLR